jgi:predicted metalloprotease
MMSRVSAPSQRRRAGTVVVGAAVLAVLLLVGACSQVVPGRARAALAASPTPTAAFAAQPDPANRVAAATTAALQEFWRAEFPAAFGSEWRDVSTFAAVRTRDPQAAPPPCVNRAADVADQAFYCPAADAVAWDADGLIPALHERFGPVGVAVVLAHEVGHAVQSRLGVDVEQSRDPQRFPTILLESMADCYAGAALARFAEEPVAGLPLGAAERDQAMQALVGFRDPLGVEAGDAAAHGNAFDRVSAFQDGWREGAALCAQMSVENRTFTQRRFDSEADLARGGNLPMRELLAFVERDAAEWFTELVPGREAPRLSAGGAPTTVGWPSTSRRSNSCTPTWATTPAPPSWPAATRSPRSTPPAGRRWARRPGPPPPASRACTPGACSTPPTASGSPPVTSTRPCRCCSRPTGSPATPPARPTRTSTASSGSPGSAPGCWRARRPACAAEPSRSGGLHFTAPAVMPL